jgi:hypothetical protein
VTITFREAALHDLTSQFRYYLVTLDLPQVAIRFKQATGKTARAISEQPLA